MNETFRADNFNELFVEAAHYILTFPDAETEHGQGDIKELINTRLILTNPRSRLIGLPSRKLSLKYLAGELCYYLRGTLSLKPIAHYSKFWNKVSDDGQTVNSNYGHYFWFRPVAKGISQWDYCVSQLVRNSSSKKAVMTVYRPDLHSKKTNDNPCTMYLQFFIRDTYLHLCTYMRSNDLWFGLSYDLPFFTYLQESMLIVMRGMAYPELQLGSYMHNAGSLHLYRKHWGAADKCILEWEQDAALVIPGTTSRIINEIEFKNIKPLLKYEADLRNGLSPDYPLLTSMFFNEIAEWLTKE